VPAPRAPSNSAAARAALRSPCELSAIDSIAIMEQVGRSRLVWECLDDLPSSSGCRWMVRDVDVDEFTAVMTQDANTNPPL
jgi:hypothetical protein